MCRPCASVFITRSGCIIKALDESLVVELCQKKKAPPKRGRKTHGSASNGAVIFDQKLNLAPTT